MRCIFFWEGGEDAGGCDVGDRRPLRGSDGRVVCGGPPLECTCAVGVSANKTAMSVSAAAHPKGAGGSNAPRVNHLLPPGPEALRLHSDAPPVSSHVCWGGGPTPALAFTPALRDDARLSCMGIHVDV